MPNGLSEKAYTDFFTWMKEQYNLDWTWLQLPEVMARFGNKENPYYQYWASFIYPQSLPEPKPAEAPYTVPQAIGDVPINYTYWGTARDDLGFTLDIYVPIPTSPEDLTPEMLYQNAIGIDANDTIQQLTPEDLANYGVIVRDRLTGTVDATELYRDVAYQIILNEMQKRNFDITGTIPEHIQGYINRLTPDERLDVPAFMERMTETLRFETKLAEEERAQPSEAELLRQQRGAQFFEPARQKEMMAAYEPVGGTPPGELAGLRDIISRFGNIYKEWSPKFKAGYQPRTVSEQLAQGAVQQYEKAQEQLRKIETGEVTPQVPGTPQWLVKYAQEQQLPVERIGNLALKYAANPLSPEFQNLTLEQKQSLAAGGKEIQGQMPALTPSEIEAERRQRLGLPPLTPQQAKLEEKQRREKTWLQLVEKARKESARPRHVARI